MRGVFLYLIILIASVLLLDRCIAYGADLIYKQVRTGQSGGKINYYLNLPQQPRLLIMGDSRSFRHTNPDDFPVSSYNISHAGMDQSFQTCLLNVLVTQEKIPGYVLLQVEPSNYIKPKKMAYYYSSAPQQLKYYYDKDTLVNRYIGRISTFEKWKYFFSSYRYNGRLITLLKNAYQTYIHPAYGNGFEPIEPTNRDSINTIFSTQRKKDTSAIETNMLYIGYLDQFIGICRAHHIKLICFSSNIYNSPEDELSYSKRIGNYLRSKQIPYINFIEKSNEQLRDPWLWHDMYHMNARGAKLESAVLAEQVMQLINKDMSVAFRSVKMRQPKHDANALPEPNL